MGCFSPFPHGTGSLSVRNGFSCPALLRYLLRVWIAFVYGSVTLFGSPFQKIRLATRLVTLLLQALQPPNYRNSTGLGCSDFARHYYRNRGFFLLLEVLRWFTSLRSPVPTYEFSWTYPGFTWVGFPIRKSPDQRVCAAPRSLSQLAASFIACFCQGIHRAPLVA
jgi:hypothetical protein